MNDLNINWKDFYKNVFSLVVPMALQNLINVGVTAADVVMLGKVSEKVLSGASLAGQIQYIMVKILIRDAGIAKAATVKIAVTITADLIPKARIFSIVVLSPFPQYCAVRTVAPDVNPNKNNTMIY